jgi:lipopolysaccharide export system permease protein
VLTPLIKKLDKLIIKAFIGPFIATFFITTFVLVLQFFWLYIDDVVGKGVDLGTIGRLVLYVSATLVPLALPLAVLLSSIMTFGNLGETFELVAIKSAGIALLRFMRPLFLVCIVICYIAFLFNNYIIPVANLKMNTLKYDIIMSKPAFDIKEGVFYDRIEGYVIKIGKKGKDDSTIRDVVIYEQNFAGLQDDIIVSEKGKMIVTPDKKSLEFKLQNGSLYREKGDHLTTNTEFVRMGFSEYEKVLDLSSFKLNRTDDNAFKNNYQMLSLRQLGTSIDSLVRVDSTYSAQMRNNMRNMLNFPKYLDTTGWDKVKTLPLPSPPVATSTTSAPATNPGNTAQTKPASSAPSPKAGKASVPPAPLSFRDLIPDSARTAVLDRTLSILNGVKVSLDQPALLYDVERNELRNHQIAWHEKLTLSVACLVMFLIGAPLGSIIRRGGIGLPLVFAVIFFVIFFLLNNFGKKFVKQDVLSPIGGMWLATYILTPVGLFLVYKALNDSQIFNKEVYKRAIVSIRNLFQKTSRKIKHEP